MAKKFVRGVTGVDDIESFDKTLTNVNDIISDGHDTYVHTKKGKNEIYYNLTDSLKSVESDNSNLITVTKDDTTNIATLQPKHDAQKEQSLESTRDTVSIQKGANGTNTTTKLDTNPQKVLEHENLIAGYGLVVNHDNNISTINIKSSPFNNPQEKSGVFRGTIPDEPYDPYSYLIFSLESDNNMFVQMAFRQSVITPNKLSGKYRFITNGVASNWYNILMSETEIKQLIATKQNTITNNTSIGVSGTGLQQLYALKQTYSVTGGLLKTHVKSVSQNTSVSSSEEEFNFIVKIDKSVSSVNFTLNTHDTQKFGNIISTYGSNNTVRISGCVFTLSGSTLTVSTSNNTNQNYVITFSDII